MGNPELARRHPVIVTFGSIVVSGGLVLSGMYADEFFLGPVAGRTTPVGVMARETTAATIGAMPIAGGYLIGVSYRRQYDTYSSFFSVDGLFILGLLTPVIALFGLLSLQTAASWAVLGLVFYLGQGIIEGTLVCLFIAIPKVRLPKVVR